MINACKTEKQQGQRKIMRHVSFPLGVLCALSAGRSVSLCLWRVSQHQTPCHTQSQSILAGSKTVFSARVPNVVRKRDMPFSQTLDVFCAAFISAKPHVLLSYTFSWQISSEQICELYRCEL